jgi:hypothetical protein
MAYNQSDQMVDDFLERSRKIEERKTILEL